MMNKENIVFKDKFYPVIELFDFNTADGYHVDHGIFISEDFIDADDNRIIDEKVYAYLPREFMEKCTEKELRKYIKKEIG